MARKAREKILYGTYLIIQQSGTERAMFENDQDRKAFLNILKKVKEKFDFHLYGYCLISDTSYRLLIYDNGSDISKIMKAINIRYAMYAKCQGKLYKDRYKSHLIQDYRGLVDTAQEVYGTDKHCAWNQFSVILDGTEKSPLIDGIPNQKAYRPYLLNEEAIEDPCDLNLPLCEKGGSCYRNRDEVEAALKRRAAEEGLKFEEMKEIREIRDRMICRVRRESTLSLKAIGEIFGLSESAVCKIVNR